MRTSWAATVLMAMLIATTPGRSSAQPTAGPAPLPSRVLVQGVPFIPWNDAARLEYQDKDILNPSFPASVGMILAYWGQDLGRLRQADDALPKKDGGWGISEQHQGGNLQDLKALLAKGIPVVVDLALTPIAHTPSPLVAARRK